MRILIGTLMHETNTFNTVPTEWDEFRPIYGSELFRHTFWRDNSEATGGIVQVLEAEGAEIVPSLHAFSFVSGTVTDEAYAEAKRAILQAVRDAGPLDGIVFALHGSMYTRAVEDPEGDLVSAVRALVGPKLPIVCALDMHATVTDRLVSAVNAIAAFRTAPHIDRYHTGVRAAELLLTIIRRKLDVVTVAARLPFLLSGENSMTAVAPMKDAIARMYLAGHANEVMNADYVLGFPWADTPNHGVCALVCGEARYAQRLAEEAAAMAAYVWERRREFVYSVEAHAPERALDVAFAAAVELGGPVVVSDTGDNPTAGAGSDVTAMLALMLTRGDEGALFAVVADRASYARCAKAGVGAAVELQLGRSAPEASAPPLAVRGEVLDVRAGLADPKRIKTSSNAAIVRIGGVTVIVAEERIALYDPGYLDKLGLRAADYRVIVLKSGYQSPAWQAVAAKSLFALTPGHTNIDLATIPYARAPRPIYPLDADAEWRQDAELERIAALLRERQA